MKVQEYTEEGDIERARKASRQTCYWSTCTLIFGWTSLLIILIAIGTVVITCYELHQTCGFLLINNFTHTKL